MKRPNRTSAMISILAAATLLPLLANGASAGSTDTAVFGQLGAWCDDAAGQRAQVISAADKLPNTKRAFIARMSNINSGTLTLGNRIATLAPSDATNQALLREMSAYLNGRYTLVDNVIKKSKAGQIQKGLLLLRQVGPEHAEIELNLQRRVYAQSGTTCSALVSLPSTEFTTTTTIPTTIPTTIAPTVAPTSPATTNAAQPTVAPSGETVTPSSSTPPRTGLSLRSLPTIPTTTTPAQTNTASTVAPTTAPAPVRIPVSTAPTTTQHVIVGTATTIPVSTGGAAQYLPTNPAIPLRDLTADEVGRYRSMIAQLQGGTAVTDVTYRAVEGGGMMFVTKHDFFAISQADQRSFDDGVILALRRGGLSFDRTSPIGSFTDVAVGGIQGHTSLKSLVAFRSGLYVLFITSDTQDVTALAQTLLPSFRS